MLAREKCSKACTRFTTPGMTVILPPTPESLGGWNTPDHYFYEIATNDRGFRLSMCVSSHGLTDEQRAVCGRINEISPSKIQKKDWQWRSFFTTNKAKVGDEYDADKLKAQLDKMFAQALQFESNLQERLKE